MIECFVVFGGVMKRFIISVIFVLIFASCEELKDIAFDDFDVTKIECGIDFRISYPENLKRNSNDCPIDTLCNGKHCVYNKCDELTVSKCNDSGKKCDVLTGECIDESLFCTDFNTPKKVENSCGIDDSGYYYYVCKDWNWEKSTSCNNIDTEILNCDEGCIYNKCTETEETSINNSCGLNNLGTEIYICTNGDWVLKECDDPDECTNGEKKSFENSCGPDNSGTQKKICENGQWIIDKTCDKTNEVCFEGCTYIPVCENGTTQTGTTVCGLNDEGFYVQICENKQWIDDTTNCTGTDECTNGTEQTVECGLNGLGEQNQECANGRWENNGDCEGDDVCTNGTEQTIECGLNNRGDQNQKCEIGQWVNNGNCIDPDVCTDNEGKQLENSCGFNGRGEQNQICSNGQWEDSTCDDPDVCIDGRFGLYELCGFNNNGYKESVCVNGQWTFECKEIQSKMIGSDSNDRGEIILRDENDNIYIIGNIKCHTTTDEDCKYKIYKYDNNLTFLLSSSESSYSKVTGATLDVNGGIIVVGYNYANNRDLLIERYETTNLTKTHWRTTGTLFEDVLTDVYTYKKPNNTYEYYAVGYTGGDYVTIAENISPANIDLFYIKLSFADLPDSTVDISKEYQFGVNMNNGNGDITPSKILVDDNYVYISGHTNGNLEDNMSVRYYDLFFMKIDKTDKTIAYKKQFSTYVESNTDVGYGYVHGMKFNGLETVVITGYYEGIVNNIDENLELTPVESRDFAPFFLKINSDYSYLFKALDDTSREDNGFGMATSLDGNYYIVGYTDGSTTNNQNYYIGSEGERRSDAFITKFNQEGTFLWTKQIGSDYRDEAIAVVSDSIGNVFITGRTNDVIGENQSNLGNYDIFISKLSKRLICTTENNQDCQ